MRKPLDVVKYLPELGDPSNITSSPAQDSSRSDESSTAMSSTHAFDGLLDILLPRDLRWY